MRCPLDVNRYRMSRKLGSLVLWWDHKGKGYPLANVCVRKWLLGSQLAILLLRWSAIIFPHCYHLPQDLNEADRLPLGPALTILKPCHCRCDECRMRRWSGG